MATDNMPKNLVNIGHVVLEIYLSLKSISLEPRRRRKANRKEFS